MDIQGENMGDSFMPLSDEGVFGSGFHDYRELFVSGISRCGIVHRYGHRWFVKSLADPWSGMTACRGRLQKEYEILVGLNHPGIVRALELCDVAGVGLSIVSEYVEGTTLTEYIGAGGGKRSDRRAVALKLLEAVAYLHSAGVVHLDLKPDNVMVAERGGEMVVKIIDFGLSDSDSIGVLKEVGGSRGYAAPEQWLEGYVVSPAADVYSLGKILRELDCGILIDIVARRAMSDDPRRRYRSASEMIQRMAKMGWHLRLVGVAAMAAIAVAMTVVVVGRSWLADVAETDVIDSARVVGHSIVVDSDGGSDSINLAGPASVVKDASEASVSLDRTADYDKERDRLLEEIALAYERGVDEVRKMESDRTMSLNELKMAVLGYMPAVDQLRRFAEFINSCPRDLLESRPYEWQTFGSSERVREACDRFVKEQNRIISLTDTVEDSIVSSN